MSVRVINIENGSVNSKGEAISVKFGDKVEFSNDSDCGVTVSFLDDCVPLKDFENPLSICGNTKVSFDVEHSRNAGQAFNFKCQNEQQPPMELSSIEPDGSIIIND